MLKQLRGSVRAAIGPSGPVALSALCMALLLVVALAACGDGNDTPANGGTQATPRTDAAEAMNTGAAALAGPRMTLQEYAEACPEKNNPNDALDAASWGSIARRWENVATWLKDTTPPEELAAYHHARMAYAEEVLAFVRNKPEDEVSSSNEALAAFSAFDSWDQVNDAIREADSATFDAMRAERCW